jgi:phosphohistidine phosphatase
MRLFLVRHAIAEDAAPGQPDAARPLSEQGRARFEEELRGLRRLGVNFGQVRFSPARRALETAELLAALVEGELQVDPLLAAAPGPQLLASLAGDRLALVGHEPWLSQLAGLLVESDTLPPALKKGGLLELEGDPQPGGMRLVRSLEPAALRELGQR